MKKDILRGCTALFFIFITLIFCAFFKEFKDKAKDINKEESTKELNEFYEYNLENVEFNLPVIVINTNGDTVKRQEDIVADMQVYDSNNNTLQEEPSFKSKINISIRGNSTSKYPKKQYSLEFINSKGEEKSKKILDMEKGSDWVLNGPFSDKSLMRNYIVYKTSRNIMKYAPDVKFCEVFVIDDNSKVIEEKHYKGVYVLIEKIKRDENRVEITKSQDNTYETSFIVSKDRLKETDIGLNSYGVQTYIDFYGLNIEYPKKNLTRSKYEYINKYISEFERVLYSDKFKDPIEGYRKYIDVESFVDYYIINEFFKNTDAGLLSTYFYKDYEGKLKAGPIWDFNKSLGNHNEEIGIPYDYKSFFMINRPWFDRLMEDKSFSTEVVKRFKELRETYLSEDYLIEMIDETVVLLGDAPKRNFYKWPIDMCNQAEVFEDNGDVTEGYSLDIEPYKEFLEKNQKLLKSTEYRAKSYEEEISMMKEFIINRGKWMDDNIDSLSKWGS